MWKTISKRKQEKNGTNKHRHGKNINRIHTTLRRSYRIKKRERDNEKILESKNWYETLMNKKPEIRMEQETKLWIVAHPTVGGPTKRSFGTILIIDEKYL